MSVVVEPRLARRLLAADAAAMALLGLLLVLLVATLMGGLVPPSSCEPGASARYAPSAVALADIPGDYLRWIRQAGDRYGLDWSLLAGIFSIETDFGRLDAPGVRSGENSAGAGGPGQIPGGDLADLRRRRRRRRRRRATTRPTRFRAPRTCCAGTARRRTTAARSSPTTMRAGTSTTSCHERPATAAPRRPTRTRSRRGSSPTQRARRVRNRQTPRDRPTSAEP